MFSSSRAGIGRHAAVLAVLALLASSLLTATAAPPVNAGIAPVAQAAPSAQEAPHTLFESKNAGRTVPDFSVTLDGRTYPNQNTNYIEARDGALWNGASRLRWIGYDSPNYAFLEDPDWHTIQTYEMEDLIKTIAQSNSKVVRVYSMGFQILPTYTGNVPYTENGASIAQAPKHIGWNPTAPKATSVNPAPSSYTQGDYYLYEPVWQKVDTLLALADRYGVRVIFPFVNEWDWFGGRGAFANYYGINSTGSNFYGTNANSLFMGEMYDRLVGMIMDRVNTVTGIQYKNDPAVMAWESSNEFTGADSQWTINRATYLHDTKNISQLFMDGTYTQGAASVTALNAYKVRVASPYIDVMNDHYYAATVPNYVAGMVPLLQVAKAAGKPYVAGEYGLTSANEVDHLLRAIVDYDVDGAMIWSLRYRDARGGFYWHRDDQSTNNINFESYHWPGFAENSEFEEKSVVDTIYKYSYAINGQQAPPPPVPDTAPLMFTITSPAVINWRGTTGANGYDLERSTSADGPWTVIGHDVTDSMSVVRDGPLFRDLSTQAGTNYYYRVRGRNTNNPTGWSPYSNVVGPVDGDVSSFGANLVAGQDPGFEAGTTVPAWVQNSTTPGVSYRSGTSPSVGVAVYATDDKHSGSQSIKLTGTGELWDKFTVQPENTYIASFWMKTTANATKYTVLSREESAGVDNGFGDIDPYQYRGVGPGTASGVLAFNDYSHRTILTSVDKEYGNSITDVPSINDGQWHYYTVTFNGGGIDINKGSTEANLVISNKQASTTIYVDDINVHQTALVNGSFNGWGLRWNATSPWVFKSLNTSNNNSTAAVLEAVNGTGAKLSQDVLVKPNTDYALDYTFTNTSNGVKYAILDGNGGFIVAPTTVATSTVSAHGYVTFNSGTSGKVTVAFYDAVKTTGAFRVDNLDLIPAANAAFANATGGGVVTEPPLSAAANAAAIENGDGTIGSQALFDALWTKTNLAMTLNQQHATGGMYAVRVDYGANGSAVKTFSTPLNLSGFEGLSVSLQSEAGSHGTVQLVLTDSTSGTATFQFPLSDTMKQQFARFPTAGFNAASVAQATLSVLGGTTGTFYFDDAVAASPYVVDSGAGTSTWLRLMSRPGDTTRTASSAILTASQADSGIANSASRSVTFTYNDGTNQSIKVWSEIARGLGSVDWSNRDALQFWIKRGTTTAGSDTRMAVRLYLANGQYAEAPYRLNNVDPAGSMVTLPFSAFTVYPSETPFDPTASRITGAGLVFSQWSTLVANIPTTSGSITIPPTATANVVFIDDVRAVTNGFATLAARATHSAVNLTYTDPDFFDFSSVQVQTFHDGNLVDTRSVAPGVQHVLVDGLTNGLDYTFTLTALAGSTAHGTASITSTPGKSATTTSVDSDVHTSVFGQPVTFTATVSVVAPDTGTPSGTVEFWDGATDLGPGTLSGGIASSGPITSLAVGTHSITAVYGGDSDFTGSDNSATPFSQAVNKADTTISITNSADLATASVVGQPYTVKWSVSITAPGAGAPTGTVSVTGGSGCSAPVAAGQCDVTSTSPTTESLVAHYAGDGNFNGSDSGSVNHEVDQAATTTVVSSDHASSVFGQPVTFSATVAAAPPAVGTPTGTVEFWGGASSLGSGTLTSGHYDSVPISALGVGLHTITAVFTSGDTNFTGSTSADFTQTVAAAGTTIAITNPTDLATASVVGQPYTVKWHVSVTSPGAGTPTGTVSITGGSGCSADIAAGQCDVTSTSPTTEALVAHYPGDGSFNASDSGSVSHEVDQAATTTGVTSSQNPSVFGQAVTFTATVSAAAPGAGAPSGSVQFKIDGSDFGSAKPLNGSFQAQSDPIDSLSVSDHDITAVYSGDTNFSTSTSADFTQTVHKADTATAVSSNHNSSVHGQAVTFTATVRATAPGAGTPGGTVQFTLDGRNLGAPATLDGSGHADSPAVSNLTTGSHTITAVYAGDGSFRTSTSFDFIQGVDTAATSTSISSNHNLSVHGQSVTFTATVTAAAPGGGTPTGTVQFKVDGVDAGVPVSVDGTGHAAAVLSTLTTGSRSITAVYSGGGDFSTSTSGPLSQTVNKAAATTTLASNHNPSVFGQAVTFTATVSATAPGGGTPAGLVQFTIDGVAAGAPVALAGGHATLTTSTLSAKAHKVVASYLGSGDYKTSATPKLTQKVNKASTRVVVSSSPNPSRFGHSITLTAVVAARAPGAGTPTGKVQFSIDGHIIGGPMTLSHGRATLTVGYVLTLGRHPVRATIWEAPTTSPASAPATATPFTVKVHPPRPERMGGPSRQWLGPLDSRAPPRPAKQAQFSLPRCSGRVPGLGVTAAGP